MADNKCRGTEFGKHDGCWNEKTAVMGLPLIEKLEESRGIDWKADDVMTMTSRDYNYKTIDAVAAGDNLYFRFRGTYKGHPKPQLYFVIRNYRSYTAGEVLSWLFGNSRVSQSYPLGSHFEDIVRRIYKRDGLGQGFMKSTMKGIA